MRRRMMMAEKKQGMLPSEYTRLNYIEANGSQWINTNYENSNDYAPYKIETEYQFTKTTGSYLIFGTANSTSNINPLVFGISGSKNWFGHYGKAGSSVMWGTADTNKHISKYVFGEGIYIDNVFQVETEEQGKTSSNSQKNIGLFTRIRGTEPNTYAYAKIYSCKFYEKNDVLVRDFIPCIRNLDNKIGLYDLVTKQFYGNAGKGEFIGG